MIHIGKNTKSTIISKGISAGESSNAYRGLVLITKGADRAKNFTQCDSLILNNNSSAITVPYIQQASTFLVNGFCKEVFNNLPLEFAAEANKLMAVQLENTIG
jgi:Fe-S cluster assembly protein SufB